VAAAGPLPFLGKLETGVPSGDPVWKGIIFSFYLTETGILQLIIRAKEVRQNCPWRIMDQTELRYELESVSKAK
jgi:hypothetical protein